MVIKADHVPSLHILTSAVAPTKGSEINGELYYACATIDDWIVYRTTPVDDVISPTSTVLTTTTTSSPTQTPTPSKGFSSAAIAGVVVGPICGVALILGLVFMLLRRRRNKDIPSVDPSQPITQQYPPQTQHYPPPTQQHQQYPQLTGGYSTQFGAYGDGNETVQVPNTTESNKPMSMPPAYVAPSSPESLIDNTAIGAMALPQQQPQQQEWMNNQTPLQPSVQLPQMQIQGGRPATVLPAELGTNQQFTKMPSELPDRNR